MTLSYAAEALRSERMYLILYLHSDFIEFLLLFGVHFLL